ncbi:MAG: hypothetical protein IJE01_03090 [Clostridia bacterium]|nr:hypothetical protein [Clostridia bacterium]
MKSTAKNKAYLKIALALSLCAMVIWTILGTSTSLAWFTDTSPEINNIFHFADFKLEVSHQLEDGSWEIIDEKTTVFNDKALYEPGYVQIVYLKVKNKGTVPFKFHTAVNVNGSVVATNVFGQKFMLQEHLKFGILTSNSESEIKKSVARRNAAVEIANMPLENYSTNTFVLLPETSKYIALIVRMPEEIDNKANYRGNIAPKVELGITVKADQI